MPRSILKLAYTELPSNPSPAFPTQTTAFLPLLEVAIEYAGKAFSTLGLIDSGAACTYVPTQIADALGIDWKKCPECPIQGVAGSGTGYAADVRLVVIRANHGWPIRAVFSEGVNQIGVVLLGQSGFFDHCEVNFRRKAKEFRIKL